MKSPVFRKFINGIINVGYPPNAFKWQLTILNFLNTQWHYFPYFLNFLGEKVSKKQRQQQQHLEYELVINISKSFCRLIGNNANLTPKTSLLTSKLLPPSLLPLPPLPPSEPFNYVSATRILFFSFRFFF